MKIQARKILHIPPEELLDNITGKFTLIFDDGELETNAKQTYISSFCWEIHRVFSDLPLLKNHHLTSIIGLNGVYKSSSHRVIVENIVKCWFDLKPNYTHYEHHTLLKLLYKITNRLYNDISLKTMSHMSSMDILDFIEIVLNEDVQNIKKNGDYSQQGIKEIQKNIINLVINDKAFINNNVSIATKSNLIKSQQLAQSIGPWGYPMDVDSFPFAYPIKSGYIEGLNSLYASLTESRTAAMALQYQNNPLKDTETFSRKFQLLGMQVQNIHRGDCGSKEYHYRVIKDEVELINMEGIWRWDKEENRLIDIKPTDKHLIGKLVSIRSPFHCRHTDPNGICETCFGKLARNVVAGTNIGQQAVVSMNSVISQLVLSTKHHIGSGEVANIILRGDLNLFFKVSEDGLGYKLNPLVISNILKKNKIKIDNDVNNFYVKISIKSDSLRNITDALNVDDLNLLSPDRITDINFIRFELYHKSQPNRSVFYTALELSFQGRNAFMSRHMLKYMKNQNNWAINDKGNYDINLSNFPIDKPLFQIPPKQFNTVVYSSIIQKLLEGKVNEIQQRDENTNIATFFELFVSTVYEKMVFHFSVLQTIFYSILVTSSKDNQGALPKPWSDSGIGVYDHTIAIRSLSAALLYKRVQLFFTSPTSFLETNRPDHPFDWIFKPNEVAEENDVPQRNLKETDI